MHQLWPIRQKLPRRRSPNKRPLSALGHPKITRIEHSKAYLIPHIQQRSQGQTERERFVMAHKIPHVF